MPAADSDVDAKIASLERSAAVVERSDNVQAKKWFWFKLALLYTSKKNEQSYNKAAACLQNCLRIDRHDVRVWQSLGEVYLARGSYSSAMKAFQMALSIKGDHDEYAALKVADIQRVLAMNVDAIRGYEALLAKNDKSVPCLLGLARCKLDLAEESFKSGLLEKAYELINRTIKLCEQVLQLRNDLCAPFNLIANCCLMVIMMDGSSNYCLVFNGHPLLRADVIQLGLSNIKQALKLSPESAELWHNLALFEWKLYQAKPLQAHKHVALSAVKKAIALDPDNPSYWSSLAVIVNSFTGATAIAQHALLKAISVHKTSPEVAYTNLGVIALTKSGKENEQLAFKCFSSAQALEPAYPNGWVGQCFLAERMKHADTEDLFRHSTSLPTVNREAQRGFVYHTLANNNHRNYVQAVDVALQLVTFEPRNFFLRNHNVLFNYNSLALLYERVGELDKAMAVLEKTATYIKHDGQNYAQDEQDTVMLNHARLSVLTSEKPLIETLDELNCSEKGVPFYALALYKNGKFDEALNMIRIAYQQTKLEHVKDNLGIVAGFICRRVGKPMHAPLFGTQLEANAIAKLTYLCLDGIISRNEPNITRAIAKLFEREADAANRRYVIKSLHTNSATKWLVPLAAGSMLLHAHPGRSNIARRITTSCLLHAYPHNGLLWLLHTTHLLLSEKLTTVLIRRVTTLLRNCKHLVLHAPSLRSPLVIAIIYSLQALTASFKDDRKQCRKLIQHAIVLRPESKELRAALQKCDANEENFADELLNVRLILRNVWHHEFLRQ